MLGLTYGALSAPVEQWSMVGTAAVALVAVLAVATLFIEGRRFGSPGGGAEGWSKPGRRLQGGDGKRPSLVVLIAAHNEEASIVATLRSQLAQHRRADKIVVAADNCTDRTVVRARAVGVTVLETRNNRDKKPGALNQAWQEHCQDADLVVCIDADTVLDPDALGAWEAEFLDNPNLGGCSAKFTMLVRGNMGPLQRLLVRVQRAEFAKWTDLALKRSRRTNVLAGTACCLRNDALRQLASWRRANWAPTQRPQLLAGEPGPWLVTSVVEDFELTYRLREMGWQTKVSATVRAYTDAMTDLHSLWAQRMKWQVGTVSDLIDFGYNGLTRFDWWQQAQGLVAVLVRLLWLALIVAGAAVGTLHLRPIWLLPPVLFWVNDVRQSFRIPKLEPADVVVAALLIPQELFAFMRAGWFVASWIEVLGRRSHSSVCSALGLRAPAPRDHWSLQFHAEHGR